jgi:hypothetical protein
MQLYDELVKSGIELDHHESDLYVLDTPAAREVLQAYAAKGAAFRWFKSEIDKRMWIEIPFAFDPWWSAKAQR